MQLDVSDFGVGNAVVVRCRPGQRLMNIPTAEFRSLIVSSGAILLKNFDADALGMKSFAEHALGVHVPRVRRTPEYSTDWRPFLEALLAEMSLENPLWGAPHSWRAYELDFELAQPIVGSIMKRERSPPAVPWAFGTNLLRSDRHGERFCRATVGSIRREWLDNVIVFSEAHLRRVPTRLTTMNEPIARMRGVQFRAKRKSGNRSESIGF
jgi:hypothetical protein